MTRKAAHSHAIVLSVTNGMEGAVRDHGVVIQRWVTNVLLAWARYLVGGIRCCPEHCQKVCDAP